MKHTRALIFVSAVLITVAIFLSTGLYCVQLINAIYWKPPPKYNVTRLLQDRK